MGLVLVKAGVKKRALAQIQSHTRNMSHRTFGKSGSLQLQLDRQCIAVHLSPFGLSVTLHWLDDIIFKTIVEGVVAIANANLLDGRPSRDLRLIHFIFEIVCLYSLPFLLDRESLFTKLL